MSESIPKPGPVPTPQQRGGAEIDEAMASVRALPAVPQPGRDQDEGPDAAADIDLDEQIETLTAAHDTLRRQLSSIDR